MNQYFYETRGREKVKDMMEEGTRSQAFRRSAAPARGQRYGSPKAILVLIGMLGLLKLLIR